MFLVHCDKKVFITLIIVVSSIQTSLTNATLIQNIINDDRIDENILAEKIINILGTCFPDALDMVVFAGRHHNFVNWHNKFPSNLSMHLIGSSESKLFERHQSLKNVSVVNEHVVFKLRYPSKLFIVTSRSRLHLNVILNRLRKSLFWNSMAIFFLVDEDPQGHCSNATLALTEAWKFDILYAIYACYDDTGMIRFYTFNPFTNRFSESWEMSEIVNIVNNKRNDSITIFRYSAELDVIDPSICQSIIFDKTQSLDGYRIRLCALVNRRMIEPINESSNRVSYSQPLSNFDGLDAKVSRILWLQLRATPMVTIFESFGFLYEREAHGMSNDLIKQDYDMGVNERYIRAFWHFETYPHDVTDMCVMTRRRDHQDQSSEIEMLMIFQTRVLTFIVLASCVATFTLMQVLKIDYIVASLEFLRTLLGMSTFREPNSSSWGWRIIFVNVVLFTFCVNIYFSTQLTSSFVIKRDDPNINNIDDLIKSGYDLIGDKAFVEFLNNAILRKRFKQGMVDDCFKKTVAHGNIACVVDCYEMDYYTLKYNLSLHVSEPLYNAHVVYIVREDWPLLKRVNEILQKMREGGIMAYEDMKKFYNSKTYYTERKRELLNINSNAGFQSDPLSLKKLAFNLYFYATGIALSFTAFVVEFVVAECWQKIMRKSRLERLKILRRA